VTAIFDSLSLLIPRPEFPVFFRCFREWGRTVFDPLPPIRIIYHLLAPLFRFFDFRFTHTALRKVVLSVKIPPRERKPASRLSGNCLTPFFLLPSPMVPQVVSFVWFCPVLHLSCGKDSPSLPTAVRGADFIFKTVSSFVCGDPYGPPLISGQSPPLYIPFLFPSPS